MLLFNFDIANILCFFELLTPFWELFSKFYVKKYQLSFLNGPKSPRVLILYPSLPKNLSAILANFVVPKASEDATMIAT